MQGVTQSIIFHDGRKAIHHIEPGMVESIINMTYLQQIIVNEDYVFFKGRGKDEGGYDVYLLRGDPDEDNPNFEHLKIATVVNDNDVIETIKEVKTLGNSIAVSLSMECKMLGVAPGDKIRIRIEKVDGKNEE